MRKPNKVLLSWLKHAVLLSGVIVVSFPLIWTVLTSLKMPLDTVVYPPVVFSKGGPTLYAYRQLLFPKSIVGAQMWQKAGAVPDFNKYLMNSVVVALSTTIFSLVGAALAAYSLSRFRFRGMRAIAFFIVLTRMLPPIALIIPLFVFTVRLGLMDTHAALILPYTAMALPLATWMLKGFLDNVPVELEEAAMIDGCTRLRSLWKVVLPLMAPGLSATAVFSFLTAWNEFPMALMLAPNRAATLPLVAMKFIGEEGVYWSSVGAAAVIASVPPVVFILFAQKYMIRGLTMGATKG